MLCASSRSREKVWLYSARAALLLDRIRGFGIAWVREEPSQSGLALILEMPSPPPS